MKLVPFSGPLGAELRDIDLRYLSAELAQDLLEHLREHLVLLFRGQSLTREGLQKLALHFGAPFVPPAPDNPVLAHGQPVVDISARDDGVLGAGYLPPHSDHSFTEYPSAMSLLYALEVAPRGGETTWYNLIAAYEALPSDRQKEFATLRVWNRNPWAGPDAYRDAGGSQQLYAAQPAPRVYHPLIRRHSDGQRGALYVSSLSAGIEDSAAREVEATLLGELTAHARQPQFAWTHRWRVGDVVLWDNRVTNHSRAPFSPPESRCLWRVQIAGDRPLPLAR